MDSKTAEFVLSRTFNAPREVVFKAWIEPERLSHWFGPTGFKLHIEKSEPRPGGVLHYAMNAPNGMEMWGRITYREISAPEKIVLMTSFSDAACGVTRHPFAVTWPLETLSTFSFAEHDGKTTLTLRAVPHEASEAECATFEAGHASMRQGWTGTLDQLEKYLADEDALEMVAMRVVDAPRELVFRAYTEEPHLRKWWGPKGFSLTTQEFELRTGGAWNFVMHGPDGTDYQNDMRFGEIVKPERVVYHHLPAPVFTATATFEDRHGKTLVMFRGRFENAAVCAKVKTYAVECNEQNLDRLEAELKHMS